jgi:hypothetical protein
MALEHRHFPTLVTACLFPASVTKQQSEWIIIHCKRDESTDRNIKTLFPGMLAKALQMLA